MIKKIRLIATIYFVLVISAGALVYLMGMENIALTIESLDKLGLWGRAVFIVMYVLGTLVLFPVTLLSFASGALHGFIAGFAIAILSATAGASLAFLLSRYFFRDWIQKEMAMHPKFRALENDVAERGWKIVALSRVSFVLPYTVLNYAFGLTQIPFYRYTFVTFVAMIPGTLLYTYLGSIAGTVAAYFQNRQSFTVVEIIFSSITVAASLALLVYLGAIVKKSINKNSK